MVKILNFSLLSFFFKSAMRRWFPVLLTIVVPVCIPFFVNFILSIVTGTANTIGLTPYTLPLLPQTSEISSDPNFIYFSFAPNTTSNQNFVQQLLKMNNIQNAKIKGFSSYLDAEHFFNMRNIAPTIQQRYNNLSFYQNFLCSDLNTLLPPQSTNNTNKTNTTTNSTQNSTNKTNTTNQTNQDKCATIKYGWSSGQLKKLQDYECIFDLSDNVSQIALNIYNLTEFDIKSGWQNEKEVILFHINFFESGGVIGNIPKNLTYEIVYNTSLLDQMIIANPDPLSIEFGNILPAPFWTGYSQTLQYQLDKITIEKFTSLQYSMTFNRMQDLIKIDFQLPAFFCLTIALAWCFIFSIGTYISSSNRSQNQLILRRLGVKEIEFWMYNALFTFIPILFSCLIMGLVWHYCGVLPFSYISIEFDLFVSFLLALLFTASSLFVSACFSSVSVTISSVLSFFLLLVPGLILGILFRLTTFFDPSLFPQWFTWLCVSAIPLVTSIGLLDSMMFALSQETRQIQITNYNWSLPDNFTPIQQIFYNYNNYTNTALNCTIPNASNIVGQNCQCIYYQQSYSSVVIAAIVLSVVVLPLCVAWITYTVNDTGFRRLPSFFMLSRGFFQKKRLLKPANAEIFISNLAVCYREKNLKNLKKPHIVAFGGSSLALKKLEFKQDPNFVSALIGETGSGKSTTLNLIAGEVSPIPDIQAYVKKRIVKLMKNQNSSDNTTNSNEMHDGTNFQKQFNETTDPLKILKLFQGIKQSKATILQNYDLTDSIDAYYVKPYVGYLPQEFTNVWMDLSCFNNVLFSLQLRSRSSQKQTIKSDAAKKIVVKLLKMMDLDDLKVQNRKASQLSGGMLKRLGLCNVMAGDPKIYLLDEITAGVDPVVKRKIWRCVEQIQQKGDSTIIMCTHDTSEIAEMAQKLTILDHGFTILNNISPFDLRTTKSTYSIKFYNHSPTCTMEVANEIILKIRNTLKLNTEISLDMVSLHGIQIFIKANISYPQIQSLFNKLNDILIEFDYADYVLSKANLDDIYIELIQFKIDQASTQNIESFQNNKRTNKFIQLNRQFGLFVKSFYSEFCFKFPSIVITIIMGLLISIVSTSLSKLINNLISLGNEIWSQVNRLNDLTAPCFTECFKLFGPVQSIDVLKKCFTYKPAYLYSSYDQQNGQANKCGWYSSWLGLDYATPSYAAIGDNRYVVPSTANNQFSIVSGKLGDSQSIENYDLPIPPNSVSYINSSINFLQEPNFTSTYNINIFQNDWPIASYIKPNLFLHQSADGCTNLNKCNSLCNSLTQQAFQCNESYNVAQCMQNCSLQYQCFKNKWTLIGRNSFKISSSLSNFIQSYQNSLSSRYSTSSLNSSVASFPFDIGQFLGAIQSTANIEVQQYNVSNINNKLQGLIELNYSSMLPNRGKNGYSYHESTARGFSQSQLKYQCGGKLQIINSTLTSFDLPTIRRPHKASNHDTQEFQQLPDRDHVTLFDIPNQPMTQFVGGILRKQMFMNVEQGDFSPWGSSYSLVSRAMSVMADGEKVKIDVFYSSNLSMSVIVSFYTSAFLLPMAYSSQIIGRDLETNINNLLSFHFISPQNYVFSILFYIFSFTLLYDLIFIISLCIYSVEIMTHFNMAMLFIVGSIESIINGSTIAVFVKNGRNANTIAYLIIILLFVLLLIISGSSNLSTILSILISGISISQLFSDYYCKSKFEWNVFFVGLISSILQLTIILICLNYQYLRKMIQNLIEQLKKEPNNQMIINREQKSADQSILLLSDGMNKSHLMYTNNDPTLMMTNTLNTLVQHTILTISDVEHTYISGTQALKSVSLDISKGQIYGLLGSNGSGKSTLMNCLAGVYRPNSGTAILKLPLNEVDLFKCSSVSKYFQVVPQHDIYWSNLTVLQHLTILEKLNGLPHPIDIDLLINTLRLSDYRNQQVCQLSGGTKRRVSIAMAMTTAPPILAFDEPTTGLGVTTKRYVREAIQSVLTKNNTLILTTHDFEEVEALIDQCCIMNQGEIIRQGVVSLLRQQCKISFELTIRAKSENVQQISKKFSVSSVRFNQLCDVWILQLPQNVKEQELVQFLNELNIYESQWNIEAVKMEHVFMELVDKAELKHPKIDLKLDGFTRAYIDLHLGNKHEYEQEAERLGPIQRKAIDRAAQYKKVGVQSVQKLKAPVMQIALKKGK